MKAVIVFVLALVVVFGAAYFVFNSGSEEVTIEGEEVEEVPFVEEIEEEEETSLGETHTVKIKNFAFIPSVTRINVGDTVLWVNEDPVEHSISSSSKIFKSELLNTNEEYSHKFSEAGRFGYNCGVHPYMKGTVVVIE